VPGRLRLPLRGLPLLLRHRQMRRGLGPYVGEPALHTGDTELGGERLGQQVGHLLHALDHLPGPSDLPGQTGGVPAAFTAVSCLPRARAIVVLAIADGPHPARWLWDRAAAIRARPDRDRISHPGDGHLRALRGHVASRRTRAGGHALALAALLSLRSADSGGSWVLLLLRMVGWSRGGLEPGHAVGHRPWVAGLRRLGRGSSTELGLVTLWHG
jgi:hypothetical protein